MHIHFDTIVVGNTDTTTVNDNTGRLALAQTLSYSISDYFNQYYISATNAKRRADLQFTAMTTMASTALSILIFLPVATSAALARSADATIGRVVVSQLARIPSAVMEETFEELYLDPLIENFITTRADISGMKEEVGNFLSLLATSMREGLGGLGSFSSHDFSIDVSQNTMAQLAAQYGDTFSQSQLGPSQSSSTSSIGMTAIASGGSIFGMLFGLASVGLDAYFDSDTFNVHMNAFMGLFSGSQQQMTYDLEMDLATILAYQSDSENVDSLGSVYALSGAQQPTSFSNRHPATVSAHLSQAQSLQELNEMRMENEMLIMKLKQENIKRKQNEVKAIEKVAPIGLEQDDIINVVISAEAALLNDPVVKDENGILIWYQPLPKGYLGIENDMTLNEFLALRGILDHPYKWLGYRGLMLKDGVVIPTSEGFRRIEGDNPLTEALEIVEYNTDTLLQQFHGDEDSLTIETDLVEIPSWIFSDLSFMESYPDVIEFLQEFDYITGNNMIESIKTEADAEVIRIFITQNLDPLKQLFTTTYNKLVRNTPIRTVYERGIDNLLKQNLLSKQKIADLKAKFGSDFNEAKYRKFVGQLYKFKFKEIIDNSLGKDLIDTYEDAISMITFNFLAESYDFKSMTHYNFIQELRQFISSSDLTSHSKEFIHSDSITSLFTTLTNHFMTTDYDYEIGEVIGTIARNTNTFFGWIGETAYLLGPYIDRIVPSLIASGWNTDDIKMFQFMERNPRFFNRLKAKSFNIEVLQGLFGGNLKNARIFINGFDTSQDNILTINGREGDIITLLIPGSDGSDLSTYTLYTTEVKTIRSNTKDLSAKPRDISLDIISLIIEASEMWALTSNDVKSQNLHQIQGFKVESDFASGMYGLADGKAKVKRTLTYTFKNIDSTSALYAKGPFDLQFYHEVTSFLNTLIEGKTMLTGNREVDILIQGITKVFSRTDFNDEIQNLFDDKDIIIEYRDENGNTIEKFTFREKIKSIARKIYSRASMGYRGTKWDLIKDKWDVNSKGHNEFTALKEMFRRNLDRLIVDFTNDQFGLIWQDSISHSFLRLEVDENGEMKPVKLEGAMLTLDPSFFGILEFPDNGINIIERTKIDPSMAFDTPMIVIHNIETGQWGLVRSDQLHIFKKFKGDYYLGYKDPFTGEVFSDVILNTKEGYLLDGRIALKGNQLGDRGINWFNEYLDDNNYLSEQNGIFTLSNCYRSIMYESGKFVFAFLQESTYNFVPTPEYVPYFKEDATHKTTKLKGLIQKYGVILNSDRYSIEGLSTKINALSNIIYQLGGNLASGGVYTLAQVRTFIPRIFVTSPYLNLHSINNRYSIPLYKEILTVLRPKANDPLYTGGLTYNPSFDPHYDPLNDQYWLNLISRSYIEGSERHIRSDLGMKQLYNTWLILIQNDLARPFPSIYFEECRTLLEGRSFTVDSELTINEITGDNDFELINIMDKILIDLIGFSAFTDLMSGILSISESDKKFNMDWILHSRAIQSKLIRDFDLRVLSYTRQTPIGKDYLYGSYIIQGKKYSRKAWYFSQTKINGFWRSLSGQRIGLDGKTYKIGNYRIDVRPIGSAFLEQYFSSYENMNYQLYMKAANLFLHNEFSKLLDPAWVDKMNFIGRGKIQQLFYERIKAAEINKLVASTPLYEDNIESWTERTTKIAQSYSRTFIDDPTGDIDLVRQLRTIIHSGVGDVVYLKGTVGGQTRFVSQQILAGNKILGSEKGLRLYIPYDEAIKYINDIWLTLSFKTEREGGMYPGGYRLPFKFAENELRINILDMYKNFYDLFSYGDSDGYTIFFTTEKGKGVTRGGRFSTTYGKILGFKEDSISFTIDNEDPQAFQEAIASMVFYLLFVPNAFVVVKDSPLPSSNSANIYFYADALGLYTHEYVQSSDYSAQYGGDFVWTQTEGEFTPENYIIQQQLFKEIFNPEDLRMFLAFQNDENKPMLDYLMNWYNRFLRVYNPYGVDLGEFNQITDLRIG